MKIEIIFNDVDTLKYKEFIRKEAAGHHAAECEFPGSSIEINSHHVLGYSVLARVGSTTCEFDAVIVNHFDK
jgi:hypothetical protein